MYDTIKFVIKESELDNAICFLEEIPCKDIDKVYFFK